MLRPVTVETFRICSLKERGSRFDALADSPANIRLYQVHNVGKAESNTWSSGLDRFPPSQSHLLLRSLVYLVVVVVVVIVFVVVAAAVLDYVIDHGPACVSYFGTLACQH